MSRHFLHAVRWLPVRVRFPRHERATIALLCSVLVTSVALSIILVTISGCGANERRTPHQTSVGVIEATPINTALFSNQVIRIRFDRAVVSASSVGRIDGPLPAVLEPTVAIEGRFLDRRTLVLTPIGNLSRSTRYRVTLTRELAAKTNGFSFDFVSVPFEIDGVFAINPLSIRTTPKLPLHFNQPVHRAAIEAGCEFFPASSATGIAVSADAFEPHDRGAAIVTVSPRTPLKPNSSYTLRCAAISGTEGDETMSGIFALNLRTR